MSAPNQAWKRQFAVDDLVMAATNLVDAAEPYRTLRPEARKVLAAARAVLTEPMPAGCPNPCPHCPCYDPGPT